MKNYTTPKKRPVLNFLKAIFSNPLVRGTLKSLPVGNLVYEIAENIKHAKDPKKIGSPLPHSAISLMAQMVFLGLIVYAFVTHQVTIDDVLKYVGPDDFKNFFPSPVDSLTA